MWVQLGGGYITAIGQVMFLKQKLIFCFLFKFLSVRISFFNKLFLVIINYQYLIDIY